MQVSYTKLRTWGECALKYRLTYIERLPRPPIAWLAFQRRMHAVLRRYHDLARVDGAVDIDELLGAYDAMWDAAARPEVRLRPDYQDGEEILRLYATQEARKRRVPLFLEKKLTVPVGRHELVAKIDRVDVAGPVGILTGLQDVQDAVVAPGRLGSLPNNGVAEASEQGANVVAPGRLGSLPNNGVSYTIIDYKLDRKVPAGNPAAVKTTSEASASKQLDVYQLAAWKGLGFFVDDVRLLYLRTGEEKAATRTRDDMARTEDWIERTASAIDAERRWEPCEGDGCKTCPYTSQCPAKTRQARVTLEVWQQGSLGLFE